MRTHAWLSTSAVLCLFLRACAGEDQDDCRGLREESVQQVMRRNALHYTHTAYALFRVGKPQPLVLRAVCMAGKAAAVGLKLATVCIVRTRLYLVRAVCMHALVT